MSVSVDLGEFIAGEKPVPLVYTFKDADGAPLVITGYAAKFQWREQWGTGTTADAAVTNGTAGEVTYNWAGAEFAGPGRYTALLWVGNGGLRYASVLVTWTVRASVAAAPAI